MTQQNPVKLELVSKPSEPEGETSEKASNKPSEVIENDLAILSKGSSDNLTATKKRKASFENNEGETNKRNEREKGNQHEEECVKVRKKVRRGEQEFYDEYQHSKNDHQEVTSEFIQRGV